MEHDEVLQDVTPIAEGIAAIGILPSLVFPLPTAMVGGFVLKNLKNVLKNVIFLTNNAGLSSRCKKPRFYAMFLNDSD